VGCHPDKFEAKHKEAATASFKRILGTYETRQLELENKKDHEAHQAGGKDHEAHQAGGAGGERPQNKKRWKTHAEYTKEYEEFTGIYASPHARQCEGALLLEDDENNFMWGKMAAARRSHNPQSAAFHALLSDQRAKKTTRALNNGGNIGQSVPT